jgi:hypothetical protein
MSHRRRIVLVVLGLLAAALVPLAAPPPAMAEGTVTVSVHGQGSVTGDGINCTQTGGPDCSEVYEDTVTQECDFELKPPCWDVTETAVATLTAGAGINGFVFDHWTNCESPSGTSCTHTVSSDVTITAVYRDNFAPSVAAPTPNSGVRRGTVTLATPTATDNAGVTKVEFYNGLTKLGEDASAPYELAWNTTTVADGAKSITAKAYDAAGNVGTSGASVFTVDNTAPTVSVTSGPNGQRFSGGSTQTWQFTTGDATSGVASRECSVVPSGSPPSFGACSGVSTHSVSGRPGGTYVFVVLATDGGGLTATSAPRTFTIDTVAPQTTIRTGPPSIVRTSGSTARSVFTLGSERGATFKCKLDARAWRACTSRPAYVVGLGAHTLRVAAVDLVGNVDRTPAVRRWTVRRR